MRQRCCVHEASSFWHKVQEQRICDRGGVRVERRLSCANPGSLSNSGTHGGIYNSSASVEHELHDHTSAYVRHSRSNAGAFDHSKSDAGNIFASGGTGTCTVWLMSGVHGEQ
jgi:hypothetical protein